MLHLRQILAAGAGAPAPMARATLTLDERRRSRLRITLDDGREAAILLPRGSALRDGDLLGADEGGVVAVVAADEVLSVARTTDPHVLLRGAYHLGNRHVPVELGDGWLAYEHDHVLDDMVRGLGLVIDTRRAPFEPEAGAFSHDVGAHGHAHPHASGEVLDAAATEALDEALDEPAAEDDGGAAHDHPHDHDHDHEHAYGHIVLRGSHRPA